MTMTEALLPEFDQEMSGVRKTLDRIPDGHMDWQPHTKSMKLGKLANHVADIPGWTVLTFDRDELELAGWSHPHEATRAGILATFDSNVTRAREVLAQVSDETAQGDWTLKMEGRPLFTTPKIAVIRTWVLNHIIHHRAQIGVYLRLLEVPVPGVYGPSADEM